jgi:hypothetical protein
MKVELKYKDGKAIGWSMDAENHEERLIVNTIRDMEFWGTDDRCIVYDGREGGSMDYAGKLKWVQKRHKK